ncbi:endonuclease/exonuclease/phosphatase family protein [Pseudomonas fontis]|uniref:Endonuclease/exonuclease/phosphatase family protein n=1 Tax=Pseudomonas fontis TaxID=2942633 RepID=A0ABT5NVV7_9PSED|nr:endonuclease/exonuclease/phosphatase family protein [Pseudomonas fontis]MDD0974231.1 endonuclease/exonuclease/phosphatase family protein [Pseudomonas fontis]MDD0992309.1 endonuclease/exonuclease/phosphatase family protein [Pseudomonas fontis]
MKGLPGSPGFGSTDQAPAVKRIRVLTVNTHKGFTALNRRFILPELREAVRSTGADLVFLQEVLGSHDRHAARYVDWPQTSQYEFLADSMWSDFAYGRNAVYPDGHHGNALLSKYPIVQHRNLDVSITGPERRGLLHCVLDVPGQDEVHAICVHLSLLESHRQKQLALLQRLLDSLPVGAPVIIAGDFNDWKQHGNRVLNRQTNLHEVFEQHHGGLARTYPARLPLLRLDRVYLRNAYGHAPKILGSKPWTHLSDHLPLAVEVRL